MAQENRQQTQTQQQPACSGNCLQCFPAQRQYCASQHALSNMRVLDKVMETLASMQGTMEAMQGTMEELARKVEAIQSGEAALFDPSAEGDLFPRVYGKDDAQDQEQ